MNKFLIIFIILISLILISGLTYSWFVTHNFATSDGDLGKIELNILDKPIDEIDSKYNLEDSYIHKNFEIQNSSDIDSFVRISYSVVYHDSQNNQIFEDLSNLMYVSSNFESNLSDNVEPFLKKIKTQSKYFKDFIFLCEKQDNNLIYYKLKPNEVISGNIILKNSINTVNTPSIIISAESIQATKKAISELNDLGWDNNFLASN